MNLRHSILAALLALTLGFSAPLLAQQPAANPAACDTACDAGNCDSNAGSCDSAGCTTCAPLRPFIQCGKCNGTCYLKVEKTTKEKSCFKVETKQICIPKVRFPWQPKVDCDSCDSAGNCATRCGRVKTILVLKKHKYECPDCKYTWEVASSGACDDANCDGGSTGKDDATAVVPPPAQPSERGKAPAVIPAQPAIVTQRATPVGATKPIIVSAEQWRNQTDRNPAQATTNGSNQ